MGMGSRDRDRETETCVHIRGQEKYTNKMQEGILPAGLNVTRSQSGQGKRELVLGTSLITLVHLVTGRGAQNMSEGSGKENI